MRLASLGKRHSFGHKHTLTSITKMRVARLGYKCSPETRAKMSAAKAGKRYRLGCPCASSTRAKISMKLTGHKYNTPEVRVKISNACKLWWKNHRLKPQHNLV
jgi:hypothetical protein